MSKLFDDASLAMIPSAYKDGKLYSIRPTDGSGDFTFSRGSNLAATRVDVNGLIEKGRENVLLQSNQFDTSPWGGVNASVTPNATTAPDGTLTASKIVATSVNAQHRVDQTTTSSSGVKTFSVYVKQSEITSTWLRIGVDGCFFDLTNGAISSISSGIIASAVALSNDWYRCSITKTNATANEIVRINAGVTDYLGDNVIGVFVWRAQYEEGLAATDYIETGASTAQAGILEDMPRLDYSGGASCPALLLEPQRSNILRQSEYLGGEFALDNVSLDYNYGTSPEGVTNSALLTQIGSAASNSMYEFNLPTTDGSYAYSFFFKAGTSTNVRMYVGTGVAEGFNPHTITAGYSGGTLNILFEDYGNGWWRASATQTLSGASTNRFSIYPDIGNQGRNVEIWGTQVEQGSYPTSYIPTYGSSVTRSQEITSNTYNTSSEGTIFVELGEQREPYFSVLGEFFEAAQGDNKIAIVYTPTSLKISYNGSIVVNSTGTYDTSSLSAIQLGHSNGSDILGGIVKQFTTFSTLLTDTEINALTV